MKKILVLLCSLLVTNSLVSQTAADLFSPNDIKVSWLGIDFSHVKLVGDFSQFSGSGGKTPAQIRDDFFVQWNTLVMSEPKKFDVGGMFRKSNIVYDIDDISTINSKTPLETMEASETPNYKEADIAEFVKKYNTEGKEGIGILMIAEALNKTKTQGCFHVVAINMHTKAVLVQARIVAEPGGFGLRNYWAGSIYGVIKEVKENRYSQWKRNFK